MLAPILRIFKGLFFLFLIPLTCAAFMEALGFIKSHWKAALEGWFGIGFATYAVGYILFLRGKIDLFETFEHEMAHSIAALLSFKNINIFAVHSSGAGLVELKSKVNGFIAIAPYFLPIFVIPFLVVRPLVSAEVREYVDFFAGLTFCFFCIRFLKEFRAYQTDLDVLGFHLSAALIIFLNTIVWVVVLSLVAGTPEEIWAFMLQTWESTKTLLLFIIGKFTPSG